MLIEYGLLVLFSFMGSVVVGFAVWDMRRRGISWRDIRNILFLISIPAIAGPVLFYKTDNVWITLLVGLVLGIPYVLYFRSLSIPKRP